MVRLYQPRPEVLNSTWKFPEATCQTRCTPPTVIDDHLCHVVLHPQLR
jgi:hypothetical protein